MRKLFAFLVWLFSFWTWKEFFLRGLRTLAASHPASGETAGHSLSVVNGQQESKLARFLASLPEDGRQCRSLYFTGDSGVKIYFRGFEEFKFVPGTGVEAGFGEFLEAVASSEIVFDNQVSISLNGDNSCEYVEAFADRLRKPDGFRRLYIFCRNGSPIPLAKCVSSVLLKIDAIQDLELYFNLGEAEMGKDLAAEFMAFIAVPDTLRVLKSFSISITKLDGEGMEQLMKPFQGPCSVLEYLVFYSLTLDAQFEPISGMLASTTSLKSLWVTKDSTMSRNSLTRGYKSIAVALCSNQSLEKLSCDNLSSMELKVLLEPLIPKNNNLQCNTTLTKLELRRSIGGKEGIETLVDMLCTNTSLLELHLNDVQDLSLSDTQGTDNVLAILQALKSNKSLKTIGFWFCTSVGGYKVLGAMMDLLLENHIIQDIGLLGTGLEKTGDADYVFSALSKRKKMKLWSIVQSLATDNPTSGRVFLCGQPYAGKTRLRMSMKQLEEFQQKDEVPNKSWIKGKIQKVFKTSHAPKVPIEDKPLERTHGIEVESVRCNGIGITIWDMAGQTDYHSFHELVMPNLSADGSSSMFLLMCNPMEQSNLSKRRRPSDIKRELEWWLRFIASNTRRSLAYCPHVSIIMTHFDHWMDDPSFAKCIDDKVVELKSQFQKILEFDEDKSIFKVDGWDVSHAREVFDFMKSHMKQLLKRLPKTISACEEVQRLLALWNANKPKQPLLKWEEFCEGLCKEVEELNDLDHERGERKKEFVAISLNDGGHIIYNEKEGVVITNPHWFCHKIVGQFLHQCVNRDCELEMVSANGIISMENIKYLILKLVEGQGDVEKQFKDILGTMMKLHICYEQDAGSIMIPSTLKDKDKSLSWSTNGNSSSLTYVGRRMACQDGTKTMLTLGFFTRLQVSFFKKLQSKNDQKTYQVFQDIIKFISGTSIEVVLQFHHGDIDILLRSHQSQAEMLEFLESQIVMHIRHLQEDPTLGCPGVRLIEYILRPTCVRSLVHAKDRKNQCVQVKDLEAKVIEMGVKATYNWPACEGLDIDYDKVSTLLGGVAWKNLLERRSHDLQGYYKEIQSLETITQNSHSNSNHATRDSWTNSIFQRPRKFLYGPLEEKLDNMSIEMCDMRTENREYHKETLSKLDNMERMIQNLEHNIPKLQDELLFKVYSKIDDLMAFSLEMQKSQIPKLAYLSQSGKLFTQFVPGLDRFQLHLMCESIHGFHEVPKQEGCEVYFGTEHTRKFLTMVAWGLKIVTLLAKIGAHATCGAGSMVPNLGDGSTFAALILDTPGFLDYQIPSAILESFPSDVKKNPRISIHDQSEAQKWIQEFLEPRCQDKSEFHKQFGLRKVRFRGEKRSIAWICDKCKLGHHNDIDELR